MAPRSLSIGELAVHFGLEPVDVEWLLDALATGTPAAELTQALTRLECTPAEAERLLALLAETAAQRADQPSRR